MNNFKRWLGYEGFLDEVGHEIYWIHKEQLYF